MSERLEGTLQFEGLIEAPLTDDDTLQADIRAWCRSVAAEGVRFELDIDRGHLTLLPTEDTVDAAPLGDAPEERLAGMLEKFLAIFPHGQRTKVVSTFRSIEVRKGAEARTLYVVGPDGAIHFRQQVVPVETTAPPEPLTTRQRVRQVGMGLLVAVAIFGISTLFVPYREWLGSLWEATVPVSADQITIDTTAFGEYFTVSEYRLARVEGRTVLMLTVQRSDAFPRPADANWTWPTETEMTGPQRMTFDALARGYVRCEQFDKDGQVVATSEVRVRSLQGQDEAELPILLPRGVRPTRIVLTW